MEICHRVEQFSKDPRTFTARKKVVKCCGLDHVIAAKIVQSILHEVAGCFVVVYFKRESHKSKFSDDAGFGFGVMVIVDRLLVQLDFFAICAANATARAFSYPHAEVF